MHHIDRLIDNKTDYLKSYRTIFVRVQPISMTKKTTTHNELRIAKNILILKEIIHELFIFCHSVQQPYLYILVCIAMV